jgi:hypothetical protein
MDPNEFQKSYGKLIAKAWSDHDFKAQLLSDPMTVFKENDVTIPEGIEVRMVENTEKITHFILPPEPSDELSDEQLEVVDGGNFSGHCACMACGR